MTEHAYRITSNAAYPYPALRNLVIAIQVDDFNGVANVLFEPMCHKLILHYRNVCSYYMLTHENVQIRKCSYNKKCYNRGKFQKGLKPLYNQKLYNQLLLGIAIIIFFIMWLVRGGHIDASVFTVMLSATGLTLAVDKLLFKMLIWKRYPDLFYRWLSNIPYLGGCWEGFIYSSYVFPDTGEVGPPIMAKLEITHEFDSIHIKMETNKSYSTSYLSGTFIDEGKQKYLCYLYGNDADQDRHINPKHDGSTKLRIKHDGELKLEGHYWTGRATTGKMEFVRVSKKNSRA